MSKIVGATFLVLALLLGLSFRPDDGTPVTAAPVDAAAMVAGSHHAKPVPRTPQVSDIVSVLAVLLPVVLVFAGGVLVSGRPRRDDGTGLVALFGASVLALRGPPSPV